MPFGKCNECTYCRSTYFLSFCKWRSLMERKAYLSKEHIDQESMPENAVQNEYWKCCRHAPSNKTVIVNFEKGECAADDLPSQMPDEAGYMRENLFPKLSAQDVWLGECGCGEFELDEATLVTESK